MQITPTRKSDYDVVVFSAHPDDLEAVIGGTTVKMLRPNPNACVPRHACFWPASVRPGL